jgi:hypothetical protein
MAVLFEYEAKGSPAELLKKYKSATAEFSDPKHQKGLIAHICVETEDGIRVFNLMESAEEMHKLLNDPKLGEVVDRVGLSSVQVSHTHRNFKVHDYHVKR